MRINKRKMKLFGVIRFGGGLNRDFWVNEAKAQGYTILIVDGGCELWK